MVESEKLDPNPETKQLSTVVLEDKDAGEFTLEHFIVIHLPEFKVGHRDDLPSRRRSRV